MAQVFADQIETTPGHRITIFGARQPGRAAALAGRHGAVHGSYEAAARSSQVDVVYVATVNSTHRDIALTAIAEGKAVLVEKPLACTVADAQEIASAARDAGVFCAEALWTMTLPLVRRCISHSTSQIGRIRTINAALGSAHHMDAGSRFYDPALGGGAGWDLGVYPLHLVLAILGVPGRTSAVISRSPTCVDDEMTLSLQFGGGATARIEATFHRRTTSGMSIDGEDGTIWIGPRTNHPQHLIIRRPGKPTQTWHDPSPDRGYVPEMHEVGRCVTLGLGESPLLPLDRSVAVIQLIEEALRTA